MTGRRPKWGLVLLGLLAVFTARVWLYGAITPLGGYPDELYQFGLVRLVQILPQALRDENTLDWEAEYLIRRHREATADFPLSRQEPDILGGLRTEPQHSIYFSAVAGLLRRLNLDDPLTAWRVVRWLSMLLSLVTLALTWLTARLVVPDDPWPAVLATGLVGLMPQFGYVSASANPEHLAIVAGAAVFACLAWLSKRGLAWGPVIGLVILALALAWLKRTVYFVYPTLLIGLLWAVKRYLAGRPAARWVWLGLAGIGAGLVGLVLFYPPAANWFTLRVGVPIMSRWVEGFNPNLFRQRGLIDILLTDVNLADPVFWLRLKSMGFIFLKSLWGYFGHMEQPLAWGWYLMAGGIGLVGLAGLTRLGRLELDRRGRAILGLFGLAVVFALGLIFIRHAGVLTHTLAQGRHLFPALPALAVLWAVGWRAWFSDRTAPLATAGVLALVWLSDLVALWTAAVPWFYRLYL